MHVDIEKRLKCRERPDGLPIMHQDWNHLLFLHWKYNSEQIQKTLPPGLFVDTFEEESYVTITPFSLQNLKIFNLLYIPILSDCIEINVRTYVYNRQGIPGIWFYSLYINSLLLAKIAKYIFSLPYDFANLKPIYSLYGFSFEGFKKESPKMEIKLDYQPIEEDAYLAETGSLDFFLIERYVLYSFSSNQIRIQKVHHNPYPLRNVFIKNYDFNLLQSSEFNLIKSSDLIHYSPGVSVDIFPMKKESL